MGGMGLMLIHPCVGETSLKALHAVVSGPMSSTSWTHSYSGPNSPVGRCDPPPASHPPPPPPSHPLMHVQQDVAFCIQNVALIIYYY